MTIRVKAPRPPERVLYIDATDQIVGRLATIVAKKLLEGYRVYIFNAEKAVLSGDPLRVIWSYQKLLKVKVHVNPYKWSMHRPRDPRWIVKDAVEGMLPKHNARGREAKKRLKVYIGVPEEFKDKKLVRFPEADASRLAHKFIRVEEVAKAMGWKGVLARP
ncbi:MAG TPA: 50S ribosomal protein L13 [Pyrodictium sp.]|nr:50S ribosomal protein L13 [Pyrodictium sp.]